MTRSRKSCVVLLALMTAMLAGCVDERESMATFYVTGMIHAEWTSDEPPPTREFPPDECILVRVLELDRSVPEIQYNKLILDAPSPGTEVVTASLLQIVDWKHDYCGPRIGLQGTEMKSGVQNFQYGEFFTAFTYEIIKKRIIVNDNMLSPGDSVVIPVDYQSADQRFYGNMTVEYLGQWGPSQFLPFGE